MTVTLRLNGREATLDCAPSDMLAPTLRAAGLTSVRETCRIGVCGSCTVLLDGEPVSGSLTMAGQAVSARLDLVGIFDPGAGPEHAATFPATMPLAGAAFDGVGIPACIASGERAAEDVSKSLEER